MVRIQKYKQICRKHYHRADNYKTKHLEHEYEMKDMQVQLESAYEKANQAINKAEQLRHEKDKAIESYETRMRKIVAALSGDVDMGMVEQIRMLCDQDAGSIASG